VKEIIISTSE